MSGANKKIYKMGHTFRKLTDFSDAAIGLVLLAVLSVVAAGAAGACFLFLAFVLLVEASVVLSSDSTVTSEDVEVFSSPEN